MPSAHHLDPKDPTQPAEMNECEHCTHKEDVPRAWKSHEKDCKADRPEFDGVKRSIEELKKESVLKVRHAAFHLMPEELRLMSADHSLRPPYRRTST